MTFKQYATDIEDSLAKYVRDMPSDGRYIELVLGLYEEASEVISPIRRTIKGGYHEENIDLYHLKEEIGDVLWYMAQISNQLPDCNFQQVALDNFKKMNTNHMTNSDLDNDMTINEYVDGVVETYRENLPSSIKERVRYFCLGLIKEIGSISEIFGEHRIDGNVLNVDEIKDQMGDALLYLSAISQTYGLDLEKIAIENIEKVHGRYNSDGTVRKVDEKELGE